MVSYALSRLLSWWAQANKDSVVLVLSRSQWNVLLVAVLLLGSVFVVATRAVPAQGVSLRSSAGAVASTPAPRPNHPAPDFILPGIDGNPVRLSQLKGQVVLINIWATWCPPCRAEMPAIQTVHEKYRARGFTVLAVNVQEPPQIVAAFMREHGLTFPALLDLTAQVSNTYQAYALPSSYFVDRAGVIRAVYRGPMPRTVIAATVEQLLAEQL